MTAKLKPMSDATREMLTKAAAEWDDWYAFCPRCGKKLEGKLEDLRCDCVR